MKSLTCQKKNHLLDQFRVIFHFPFLYTLFFFFTSHQGKQVILQSIPPSPNQVLGTIKVVCRRYKICQCCHTAVVWAPLGYIALSTYHAARYISKRYTCSRHVNPAGFITDVRKNLPTLRKKPIVPRGGALFFNHVTLRRHVQTWCNKRIQDFFLVVFRKTIFNFRINFSEKYNKRKNIHI